MGFWSGTKKVVGHVIDLRFDRWIDFASLKKSTFYFRDQLKTLFSIKQAEHPESFEQAVARMALTPEALTEQALRYKYLFLFFLALAAALILYALLVFSLGNLMGGCISIALSLYALSIAFRFHFWHFQITQKKLGCSIREWCGVMLSKRKKHS